MNKKLMPSVRVVVAMSGGVDSSLAAFLLSESGEKGFEVIGITLKLWDYSEVGGDLYKDGRCCSLEAMNDARNVCQKIGAPHYVLDFREEFKDEVISNFINEYKKGRAVRYDALASAFPVDGKFPAANRAHFRAHRQQGHQV